jgi:hypothetical protein
MDSAFILHLCSNLDEKPAGKAVAIQRGRRFEENENCCFDSWDSWFACCVDAGGNLVVGLQQAQTID